MLLDVNSYEEYEQVLAMEAQRCGRGKLHAECDILLSVDDVIMNRETMRLLEMVQYTGSLQLASELMNVPYTRQLAADKEYGAPARRAHSPERRGRRQRRRVAADGAGNGPPRGLSKYEQRVRKTVKLAVSRVLFR